MSDFIPPDGGLRAWLVVAGSFLLQMNGFGYINACGVFQYYYQEHMLRDKSTSQIAWITTLQVCLVFGLGPIIGKGIDTCGARRTIIPFAALGVLALGLLSLCKEYWQIMLAQGLLFGVAASGVTLPAVVAVSQWFSAKRGLAVGLANCGSSFGGVVYPIMFTRLFKSNGFPAAVRWSILVVGCCQAAALLVVESPFPRRRARAVPAAAADPEKPPTVEAVNVSSNPSITEKPKANNDLISWSLFFGGVFFMMFATLAPLNYLSELAVTSGMPSSLSQYTNSIVSAGSMVGRVLPGFLSDKFGCFNIMSLVSGVCSVAVLAFWLPLNYYSSNAGILVFAVVWGFVQGGFVSLISPCVVALAGGRMENLGAKFGFGCLAIALGALVGLPSLGAVRDGMAGSNFAGLITFAGAILVAGSVCIIATRVRKGGWKMAQKI